MWPILRSALKATAAPQRLLAQTPVVRAAIDGAKLLPALEALTGVLTAEEQVAVLERAGIPPDVFANASSTIREYPGREHSAKRERMALAALLRPGEGALQGAPSLVADFPHTEWLVRARESFEARLTRLGPELAEKALSRVEGLLRSAVDQRRADTTTPSTGHFTWSDGGRECLERDFPGRTLHPRDYDLLWSSINTAMLEGLKNRQLNVDGLLTWETGFERVENVPVWRSDFTFSFDLDWHSGQTLQLKKQYVRLTQSMTPAVARALPEAHISLASRSEETSSTDALERAERARDAAQVTLNWILAMVRDTISQYGGRSLDQVFTDPAITPSGPEFNDPRTMEYASEMIATELAARGIRGTVSFDRGPVSRWKIGLGWPHESPSVNVEYPGKPPPARVPSPAPPRRSDAMIATALVGVTAASVGGIGALVGVDPTIAIPVGGTLALAAYLTGQMRGTRLRGEAQPSAPEFPPAPALVAGSTAPEPRAATSPYFPGSQVRPEEPPAPTSPYFPWT